MCAEFIGWARDQMWGWLVLITGEFIGLVWVITCGNSLLSALRRSDMEGCAWLTHTRLHLFMKPDRPSNPEMWTVHASPWSGNMAEKQMKLVQIKEVNEEQAVSVAVRGAETSRSWPNSFFAWLRCSINAACLIGGVIDNLSEADACFSLTCSLSLITSLVSLR